MTKIALADGVYWVGAIDWNLREFHSYSTRRGTTYNAYLIIDEKVALIDTVKPPFYEEMLQRIREIIDPGRIDYVISNHVEMDHSGALPLIMREAKKAQLVTAEKFGESGLKRTFYPDWPLLPVKEDSEISLGKRKLTFFPIPMLHWPDSMATYLIEDGILFPNDAFGQHLASSQRFDDEVDPALVMDQATKYYATILMPFGDLIGRALEKLSRLKIKVIAPSHGLIWRSDPGRILQAYASWGKGETKKKALVIYDTMWGSTEKMALAMAEGLASEGVETQVWHLGVSDRSDVIKETLDARALVVGCSTLNNGLLPAAAAFLTNLRGLKPKGKLGAAFGSFGWGGGAVKEIEQLLQGAGLELVPFGFGVKFVPEATELAKCFEFGQSLARRIKQ